MTTIFSTSREYPRMHDWCKFAQSCDELSCERTRRHRQRQYPSDLKVQGVKIADLLIQLLITISNSGPNVNNGMCPYFCPKHNPRGQKLLQVRKVTTSLIGKALLKKKKTVSRKIGPYPKPNGVFYNTCQAPQMSFRGVVNSRVVWAWLTNRQWTLC